MSTAIVFGATGGIGSQLVERLHQRGYELILVDRDEAAVTELAQSLGDAEVIVADFSDRAALAELCEAVATRAAAIDVAVMNAGIIRTGTLIDSSTEALDAQLDINLRAAMHLIQASAQHMAKRGQGHILATVSMGGLVALKGGAAYAATKFGLRGLLASLQGELQPLGIRVSGIYPPGVDTNMLRYEASNGGNALNFVNEPVTASDVADAFERALDSGKLEVYLSASDGMTGRLMTSFPALVNRIAPLMEHIGERGRQRYLKRVIVNPNIIDGVTLRPFGKLRAQGERYKK